MKPSYIFSIIALCAVLLVGLTLRLKPERLYELVRWGPASVSQRVDITDVSYSTSITQFNLEDIAVHNTATDCWVSLSGRVYNISRFISDHPEDKIIVQACGKNATNLFNLVKDHVPDNIQTLLNEFYIGQQKTT